MRIGRIAARIQGFHDLRHVAGGIIADIQKVLREVFRRQIGELLGHVAALAVVGAAQEAHHGVAAVVVGIDQRRGLEILQRAAHHNALGRQLARGLLLGHQHRDRDLVEAGRVHPDIRIVIPAVARARIAEADGEILPVTRDVMLFQEAVHPAVQRIAVDDAAVGFGSERKLTGDFPAALGEGRRGEKQQAGQQQAGKLFYCIILFVFFHTLSDDPYCNVIPEDFEAFGGFSVLSQPCIIQDIARKDNCKICRQELGAWRISILVQQGFAVVYFSAD